jgi:hypothetical protein
MGNAHWVTAFRALSNRLIGVAALLRPDALIEVEVVVHPGRAKGKQSAAQIA